MWTIPPTRSRRQRSMSCTSCDWRALSSPSSSPSRSGSGQSGGRRRPNEKLSCASSDSSSLGSAQSIASTVDKATICAWQSTQKIHTQEELSACLSALPHKQEHRSLLCARRASCIKSTHASSTDSTSTMIRSLQEKKRNGVKTTLGRECLVKITLGRECLVSNAQDIRTVTAGAASSRAPRRNNGTPIPIMHSIRLSLSVSSPNGRMNEARSRV